MNFYVDTCIYLDLWKKQQFSNHTLTFFIKTAKQTIYYSGFILKELSYQLTENEFKQKRKTFQEQNFKHTKAEPKDYEKAREIEKVAKYQIGFYDCIHIVLAIKTNSTLITRDKALLNTAQNYCTAKKPEELQ